MLDEDKHVYYFAWAEEDNTGHSYFDGRHAKWYRVFRATHTTHGTAVTEPMSRDEAKAHCQRIVKLTGGREI
jgi:hypothetical protein